MQEKKIKLGLYSISINYCNVRKGGTMYIKSNSMVRQKLMCLEDHQVALKDVIAMVFIDYRQ